MSERSYIEARCDRLMIACNDLSKTVQERIDLFDELLQTTRRLLQLDKVQVAATVASLAETSKTIFVCTKCREEYPITDTHDGRCEICRGMTIKVTKKIAGEGL